MVVKTLARRLQFSQKHFPIRKWTTE